MADLKPNPWGATTQRDLRFYQIGCFLVFAHTLVGIVGLVLFIAVSEYGWRP